MGTAVARPAMSERGRPAVATYVARCMLPIGDLSLACASEPSRRGQGLILGLGARAQLRPLLWLRCNVACRTLYGVRCRLCERKRFTTPFVCVRARVCVCCVVHVRACAHI